MTADEFNEKYEDYLEDRFYGMEIEDPKIIDMCDMFFRDWIKIPGFEYSQIKTKFGTSRVYCTPREVDSKLLECVIDVILKYRNYARS